MKQRARRTFRLSRDSTRRGTGLLYVQTIRRETAGTEKDVLRHGGASADGRGERQDVGFLVDKLIHTEFPALYSSPAAILLTDSLISTSEITYKAKEQGSARYFDTFTDGMTE